MLVDEYEQFQHDRIDDVVVSQSGSEEPDAEPPADDCKDPHMNSTLSPEDRTSARKGYGCSDLASPQCPC